MINLTQRNTILKTKIEKLEEEIEGLKLQLEEEKSKTRLALKDVSEFLYRLIEPVVEEKIEKRLDKLESTIINIDSSICSINRTVKYSV
jgi:acetate kinase